MEQPKKQRGRKKLPPGLKRVKPPITLPPKLIESAQAAADKEGKTLSDYVLKAISDQLERERSIERDSSNTLPISRPRIAASPELKVFWLDLCGGVAAGSQIATDAPNEPIPVSRPYDDDCYALRVFGQSMEPTIPDGSVIVVHRMPDGTSPKKESIVVYSDAYGLSLKKLAYRKAKADEEANTFGKVAVLKSINPDFPEIHTMDGGRIEAVFVEIL